MAQFYTSSYGKIFKHSSGIIFHEQTGCSIEKTITKGSEEILPTLRHIPQPLGTLEKFPYKSNQSLKGMSSVSDGVLLQGLDDFLWNFFSSL